MVTVANGARTRPSDAELRRRYEDLLAERRWTTNRLAAELGSREAIVAAWLGGEPALTQFRAKLLRFAAAWGLLDPEPADADGAAAAPVPAEPDPAEEPDGDDDPPAAGGWVLPAGFRLLEPAAAIVVGHGPGITIGPAFDRAALSAALWRALGEPAAVRIAVHDEARQLLLRAADPDADAAIRVNRRRDVSASVARWAEGRGIRAGFYPAEQSPREPGLWGVRLGEAA